MTPVARSATNLDLALRQRQDRNHQALWQLFTDRINTADHWDEPDSLLFLDNPAGGNGEPSLFARLANGFVVYLKPLALLVDPGPDVLTRALAAGVRPYRLNALYISHGHIDHYAGAESLIEEICFLMMVRRGYLLCDSSVLGVISAFHRGEGARGGPETIVVRPGEPVELLGVRITPVPMYHKGGGCGFVLEKNGFKIGYTGDTNYIVTYRASDGQVRPIAAGFGPTSDFAEVVTYREDLKAIYGDVDLLIANVGGHTHGLFQEMGTVALAHLLTGSRVKLCLATHFGRTCLYPDDLSADMAAYVEAASGVRTLPVQSRMRVWLDGLVVG